MGTESEQKLSAILALTIVVLMQKKMVEEVVGVSGGVVAEEAQRQLDAGMDGGGGEGRKWRIFGGGEKQGGEGEEQEGAKTQRIREMQRERKRMKKKKKIRRG